MMETEHEPPPLPHETPTVPLSALWISLLVPPSVTAISGLLISGIHHRNDKESFLLALPRLSAALILGFSFQFYFAVAKRYRGVSLAFLVCSYVIGQIILCLALWFGSCLLVLG